MRESQTKKTPLTLVIGDNELKNGTVTYRKFGSPDTITCPVDKFIKEVQKCINNKKYNL